MSYSYTYSGQQAAFILSGVCVLPSGVAVIVEDDAHKALANNKFIKHLLEEGELTIVEQKESKTATGARSGRGGNSKGNKPTDTPPDQNSELEDARTALKELGIMYADDETLEQLQAKLAQATE
ncbi:hypothetical protein [Acinetobacter rudis]|uniref:hypothetical protein n=1 Tax=Acinetobacter rudis TaxID=632955 RepID=UPI003342C5C9